MIFLNTHKRNDHITQIKRTKIRIKTMFKPIQQEFKL